MMSSSQKTLGTAIWIRINWLFRALSCLVISVPFIFLLYYLLYSDIHDAMRLVSRGKVTVGVMSDYREQRHNRRGTSYYTRHQTVCYDGYFEEIMVREPYGRGTTVHVVYLPESPSVMRLGNANTTFWQLFTHNGQSCKWLIAFFVIPFGLFGTLGAAFCLVNVVRGVSVDDLDKRRKQREDADRLKTAQKRQEKEQRAQAERKRQEEEQRQAEEARRQAAEAHRRAEEERRDYERRREQQEEEESRRRKEQEGNRRGAYSNRVKDERYYAEVLGVRGPVSADEVRRRYREMVALYHPDKVNHLGSKLKDVASNEMKAINEAYDYFKSKLGIR